MRLMDRYDIDEKKMLKVDICFNAVSKFATLNTIFCLAIKVYSKESDTYDFKHRNMYIYIYICTWPTVVESDSKAPFSILAGVGTTLFP